MFIHQLPLVRFYLQRQILKVNFKVNLRFSFSQTCNLIFLLKFPILQIYNTVYHSIIIPSKTYQHFISHFQSVIPSTNLHLLKMSHNLRKSFIKMILLFRTFFILKLAFHHDSVTSCTVNLIYLCLRNSLSQIATWRVVYVFSFFIRHSRLVTVSLQPFL